LFTFLPSCVKIKKNIKTSKLKDAPEDKTLTVCWKGARPFKSIDDVKKFFRPLALSFPNVKNAVMEIPPEAYLIVSVSCHYLVSDF